MLLVRALVLVLLLAGLGLLGMSLYTGQARQRRLGLLLIKWTIVAALVFFGVLIAERVVEML